MHLHCDKVYFSISNRSKFIGPEGQSSLNSLLNPGKGNTVYCCLMTHSWIDLSLGISELLPETGESEFEAESRPGWDTSFSHNYFVPSRWISATKRVSTSRQRGDYAHVYRWGLRLTYSLWIVLLDRGHHHHHRHHEGINHQMISTFCLQNGKAAPSGLKYCYRLESSVLWLHSRDAMNSRRVDASSVRRAEKVPILVLWL
jgi:hypothetical protein